MWLGEITRQRPKKISFAEFLDSNQPSELRPLVYAGGTIELTPPRIWFGDFKQRAVERDSFWFDYVWAGPFAFLLDTMTVAYRYYIGEAFALCYGPDRHVQRVTIDDRLMYQAAVDFDNAGGGFLIDDPEAWGGDQPPGEGGQYSFCRVTRGNYTDATASYLEQLLGDAPNRCPSLRGVTALISQGPSGDVVESGYFTAGGVGYTPRLKEWKVVVRGQPDNLATGFNKIGRHMNPMEVIYEWMTSLEYGAQVPLAEINLDRMRELAEALYDENNGWSGRIELSGISPQEVVFDVLDQIDAVPDNSPSLGLGFRLIRRDYSFGSLRVLDQSVITRVNDFTPGTYEDTVNVVNIELPEDHENNFKPRKAPYVDVANQRIQNGRVVPQTANFLGVADMEQGQVIATRLGRAQSLPRAPLDCFVLASWGRLTYIGEVVVFEWRSPSFSIVMRVQKVTPNGPEEKDFHLVLIEDQFSTGLRTFGEPGESGHTDPATGLNIAPPSATWDSGDFPPEGLEFTLQTTNTNQFLATITGHVVFGSYAPGGQYGRVYVTEPGGVQTLSPLRIAPDANNEAQFTWPALTAGTYEFCVQTFSLRGATNNVKVCAEIAVAQLGSPSLSPSASVSPSSSVSASPSPSASISPSSSVSPSVSPSSSASASTSPSSSQSPSASVSPSSSGSSSTSPSPSASISPSSSASPSGEPPLALTFIDGAEHWARTDEKWKSNSFATHSTAPASGVTGADGKVVDDSVWDQHGTTFPATRDFTMKFWMLFQVDDEEDFFNLRDTAGGSVHLQIGRNPDGTLQVLQGSGAFNHDTVGTYAANTPYEFEFTCHIDNAAGSYTLKTDDGAGGPLTVPAKQGGGTMTGTGLDTQNGATNTCSHVAVGAGSRIETYVDNHAIDIEGNAIDLGQVETLYPNGAGDLADLTRGGTDSGANWSQCDEATHNGNTDYVVTTVNGSTFKNQLRIGGVNYDGATTHTATTTYKCYTEIWNTNPATSAAWTDSDIDSLQAGILGIDANQRDVYTFQNRSVTGTPRAVQVTTTVILSSSRIRMTQVVVEVWVST